VSICCSESLLSGRGFGFSFVLIETAFALNLLAVDESDDTDGAGEFALCWREDKAEIWVLI
jgi:hypothetical protein